MNKITDKRHSVVPKFLHTKFNKEKPPQNDVENEPKIQSTPTETKVEPMEDKTATNEQTESKELLEYQQDEVKDEPVEEQDDQKCIYTVVAFGTQPYKPRGGIVDKDGSLVPPTGWQNDKPKLPGMVEQMYEGLQQVYLARYKIAGRMVFYDDPIMVMDESDHCQNERGKEQETKGDDGNKKYLYQLRSKYSNEQMPSLEGGFYNIHTKIVKPPKGWSTQAITECDNSQVILKVEFETESCNLQFNEIEIIDPNDPEQ